MGEFRNGSDGQQDEEAVLSVFARESVARDEGDFAAARTGNPLDTHSQSEMQDAQPVLRFAAKVADALQSHGPDKPHPVFELNDLSDPERKLLAEILGEGEVHAMVSGETPAQIAESVMAGLWLVRETDADGAVVREYLEVGDVPGLVRQAAVATGTEFDPGQPPEGAMNVMPVLAEIAERASAYMSGQRNHVISFTLLPMTEADQTHLQTALGPGPVHMVSRGYGRCRVLATGVRHVWAVQYFSANDEVILDTVEIGDVPKAACAEQEDFEDSAERLQEILEAYL